MTEGQIQQQKQAPYPRYDYNMYSIANGYNFGGGATADIDKTTMFNNNNKQTTTECGGMFTF